MREEDITLRIIETILLLHWLAPISNLKLLLVSQMNKKILDHVVKIMMGHHIPSIR